MWDVVWRRAIATLPPEFAAIDPAMRDYAPSLLDHLGGEATFPQRSRSAATDKVAQRIVVTEGEAARIILLTTKLAARLRKASEST